VHPLHYWIENYFHDFTGPISERISEFLQAVPMDQLDEYYRRMLYIQYAQKMEDSYTSFKHPLSRSNSTFGQKIQQSITEYKAGAIARQLTLIEFEIFRHIRPSEFLDQAWCKKSSESNAPNLLALIRRFNAVSGWVTSEIVVVEKKDLRVKVVQKFIRVAKKCLELNNFQSTMQILSALESSPITRLKKTWQEVKKTCLTMFSEIKAVFSSGKNYKNYRTLLASINSNATSESPNIGTSTACIPFFGICLSDLTYADESKNFVEVNGIQLINFEKKSFGITDSGLCKETSKESLHPYRGFYLIKILFDTHQSNE